MCAASRRKFPRSTSAMNGSAISMARKMARIFGTNTSVVSWICVSAWMSDTATPTINPTSISGAATRTSVTIASRATSITSGPVIDAPLVRHSGAHEARARNDAVAFGKTSLVRKPGSDRHPQNFLIGRDHLVAHRDQGLDRRLALRHGGDDVDHIGLAHGHRLRLRVRLTAGLRDGLDHVLEHGAEAEAALLRAVVAGEACGLLAHARECG